MAHPKKIVFVEYTDEGEEIKHELPTKFEVCDRCRGTGKHDHPAFKNGFSREDFDEDPDFEEDYREGVYDVICSECHGNNVVPVVDEDRCDPKLMEKYYENLREERAFKREMDAERDAERRMGA